MFWRSVDLTGNQADAQWATYTDQFWRSVDLTGNQALPGVGLVIDKFWRSVDLTGNQTRKNLSRRLRCFGAVLI